MKQDGQERSNREGDIGTGSEPWERLEEKHGRSREELGVPG